MISSSSVISSTGSKSSSSSVEQNCSALLDGETGWNWNVPKECRFNANVTYNTITDPRDNKVYKTVKIGTQTWMDENLNYADSTKTPSLLNRSWCYNNKDENCDVAGRLYTWAAAIDSVALATDTDNPLDCGDGKTCTLPAKVQGICPPGWHLPTKTEWNTLIRAVGSNSTAGKYLKSQTGWDRNGNGTNAFDFSALPTGHRSYNGKFYAGGGRADFWSATEDNCDDAHYMSLNNGYERAYLYDDHKSFALSVRCLENK